MLAALGCDPPTGFFIEPTASDGELQTYPLFEGLTFDATSAAMPSVAAEVTSVRYLNSSRQVPFLLQGDTNLGSPLLGLRLPASGEAARTESVGPAGAWNSVRVYDRGECSTIEDWYATDEDGASGITVDLAAGLLETLSSSSDISGAELRFAEFDVELNSRGRLGYDITEDVVSLTFRFFAENVGPSNVLGCKRVEYTIAMELQLVQTDAAVESMDAVDFMERCHPDASGFGLFLLANRAIEDLRARTRPTCPDETLLPTERLGLVRYDDVDSIVLREDYSGSEGSPRAHILFLFSDLSGRPLGAHDVLVRTLRPDGFEIVLADFVDEDVQADFFGATSFVTPTLCGLERDEYGDPDTSSEEFPRVAPPFRVLPEDIAGGSL